MNGNFPLTVIHDLSDEELDALEPFEEKLNAFGILASAEVKSGRYFASFRSVSA